MIYFKFVFISLFFSHSLLLPLLLSWIIEILGLAVYAYDIFLISRNSKSGVTFDSLSNSYSCSFVFFFSIQIWKQNINGILIDKNVKKFSAIHCNSIYFNFFRSFISCYLFLRGGFFYLFTHFEAKLT